jgi:hypothetical protein
MVRLPLVGADAPSHSEALEPLTGTVNSLLGDDPTRWRTGHPTYA